MKLFLTLFLLFKKIGLHAAAWVALTMLFAGSTANADTNPTEHIVRLATTTSTDNSGLLDFLLPQFKQTTGYSVQVLSVGTGKALRLGENGDVDVLLVHAPHSEKQFIKRGFGTLRKHVMSNDFIVVGPHNDPAELQQANSALEVFNRLHRSRNIFISRGDNSGTHKKELNLWKESGNPELGAWRLEVGQGMGKSLQIADELQGYLLIDRATWLALQDHTTLKLLYQGGKSMRNHYHVIAVNPERHRVNFSGAVAFIDWLTSPQGQTAIGDYRLHGMQLFKPAAQPTR